MAHHFPRLWLSKFVFPLFLLLATPLASVAQTAYIQHTVEAQETLYGIARRFAVGIDDIIAANPGLTAQNLRRGQVIRVPAKSETMSAPQSVAPVTRATCHTVQQGETIWGIAHQYGVTVEALKVANPNLAKPEYVLQVGETLVIPTTLQPATPVANNNVVRIALVMPLKAQRAEVPRCAEFYHGLLIAAEELKQQGRAVTIYAYEEDPDDASLSDLQSKLRTNPVDIIYGPLYPKHFPVLADYAKRNGVRLIIPFSSKVGEVEHNASVYVVNTPETYRNRAAAEVVTRQFGRTHIVFLRTASGNEADFVKQFKSKAVASGATFTDLPTAFSDQQILGVFANHDRVLFVPDGSEETDYRAVIKRLDKLRGDMSLLSTSLLAYPDWQKYQDTDRMTWYACDTYLFCPAFYNPYDDKVKVFVRKFRDRYHADMQTYYPRYGVFGYDLALQTMTAFFAHGDRYHGQEARGVEGVQSHLRFEKANAQGGYVNTNIWLMHFKKERAIDLIGVR